MPAGRTGQGMSFSSSTCARRGRTSPLSKRKTNSRHLLSTQVQLKRQIGIRTATALVVGEVIAVGIFLTPAGMAKSLGSPFWLLVVWIVMGAMAAAGALCYGELAARYPEAGGGYVYLREAYGTAAGISVRLDGVAGNGSGSNGSAGSWPRQVMQVTASGSHPWPSS